MRRHLQVLTDRALAFADAALAQIASSRNRLRFQPDLLKMPAAHLSGRSGRRGDQFEGQHFRLHPDRAARTSPSADRAPSRTAARGCSSSIRNGKFIREIGQGLVRLPVRARRAKSIRRTTSGWWTKGRTW